ncbi:MAG: TonB-dependent receptor [Sphingorhabdus sp.]
MMVKSRFFRSAAIGAFVVLSLSAATAAVAQEAEDGSTAEPEIVVTGERIGKTLKETTSSVIAFSAADIEDLAGPDTVSGLLRVIPNVTQSGNGNEAPTIRGSNTGGVTSGAEAAFGGARPRSTIQIDGRALTFNEYIFAGASIWDLQSLEVFRSPQTTTQGRNAISGAIFIRTADPTDEWTASARGIIGNYGTYQGSGYISGPLGNDDTVTIRLSGDYRQQRSFVNLIPVADGGASPEDVGVKNLRREYIGTFRSKLRIKASDAVTINIGYTYSRAGRPQTDEINLPSEPLLDGAGNPVLDGFGDPIFVGTGAFPENFDRFNFEHPYFKVASDGVTGALDFDLGNGFALVNTTTFANVTARRLSPPGTGVGNLNTEDLSNETLLTYQGDRLKGVAGLYFLDSKGNDDLALEGFGLFGGSFADNTKSFGIFGEFTYSPTERLHLTLGSRYQEDKQRRLGGYSFTEGDPPSVDNGILIDFNKKFSAFLPKIAIAYDVTDDVRVGVTAQRGYNPGGQTFSLATGNIEDYRAEYVTNYEAFLRSRLMDGRLLINANIFFADFQDSQRVIEEVISPQFSNFFFRNAEDARGYGLEFDISFKATDKLNLAAAFGYNNTKLKRYLVPDAPGSTTLVPSANQGNVFARAPKVTASMTAEYEPIENLTIGLSGRYSGSYFTDDENFALNRIGSYLVADAQIAYEFGNFRIFAAATNLLDEEYVTARFVGGTVGSVGDPREISAGVQVKF